MHRKLIACLLAACLLLSAGGCSRQNRGAEGYAYRNLSNQEMDQQGFAPSDLPASAAAVSDREAPKEAVAQWMDQLQGWDDTHAAELIAPYAGEHLAQAASRIAAAVAHEIEYELGHAKIDGNHAVVDLSVTAPSLSGALEELAVQAISLYALEQALGVSLVQDSTFMDQALNMVENGEFIKVTRNTSVHLLLGGDGQWKVDIGNVENLDFLDCLTGGLAGFATDALSLLQKQPSEESK